MKPTIEAARAKGKPKQAGGRPPMSDEERPKVRSIRLNAARWAKLRRMGRAWLEATIDAAENT